MNVTPVLECFRAHQDTPLL